MPLANPSPLSICVPTLPFTPPETSCAPAINIGYNPDDSEESSISYPNLQVTNNYGDSLNEDFTTLSSLGVANGSCQVTCQNVRPYLELEPYHCEGQITLNYSDLGELLTNFSSLPTHLQYKVRAIWDKQRTKSRDFWYDEYYPQTTLISLLEDQVSYSICCCGLKPQRAVKSPGLCHKPRLCWKCASLEAQKSLNVFKSNVSHCSWGFLTISFHGDLPYSTTASPDEWWRYWNAAVHGVRILHQDHHIQGAILREEIKINSIAPIRVLPHLHAIVSQPDIGEGTIEGLAESVQSYLEEQGEELALPPSIQFKPLPTEDDVEKVWFYIYKPILFYEAYNAKWNDNATALVKERINRSMREAIEAVINIPFGRRQIHYLGNMRSTRRDFIGVTQPASRR